MVRARGKVQGNSLRNAKLSCYQENAVEHVTILAKSVNSRWEKRSENFALVAQGKLSQGSALMSRPFDSDIYSSIIMHIEQ